MVTNGSFLGVVANALDCDTVVSLVTAGALITD